MRRMMVILAVMSMAVAVPAAVGAAQSDQTDRIVTDEATDRVSDAARDGFGAAKAGALRAIDNRLEALDRAQRQVGSNTHLSESHHTQLTTELADHVRGLRQLRPQVEEASTFAELLAVAPSIVTEHWIFAMMLPKTALVIGADTVVDAVEHGEQLASEVQAAIDRLEEAGIDMEAAQSELDAALGNLAAANDLGSGIPGEVLGIQPPQMPGAGATLESAHTDLKAAVDALRSAREHGRRAIELIRQAIADA